MIPVLAGHAADDLDAALDPVAALGALRRARQGDVDPEARLAVERVHFSARRPTVIHYRLESPGTSARRGAVPRLMAELIGPMAQSHAASERHRLAKPRRAQLDREEADAIGADPESGLVFRRPGLDVRLPGLRLLHRPDEAAELAAEALGVPRDRRQATVTLRAHRLAKRAVLEIALGAEPSAHRVFARLRPVANDGGAAAYQRHVEIAAGLAGNPAIAVPAPLRHVPEIGAAFYGVLPGRPLSFGAPDATPLARALAGLSAFQALDASGWGPYSIADELDLLDGWVKKVEQHLPALALPVRRAFHRTAEALGALPPSDPIACHRDLHEGQFMVGSTCAGLLDFDTSRLADPALDAGNLLAHARLAALSGAAPAGIDARIAGAGPARARRIEAWAGATALRLGCIYAFTEHRAAVAPLIEAHDAR